MERLLFISGRAGVGERCTFCHPGVRWLTVEAAAEITGWQTSSLLDLTANGELHSRHEREGDPLICAVSLALKILKGDKENETQNF